MVQELFLETACKSRDRKTMWGRTSGLESRACISAWFGRGYDDNLLTHGVCDWTGGLFGWDGSGDGTDVEWGMGWDMLRGFWATGGSYFSRGEEMRGGVNGG